MTTSDSFLIIGNSGQTLALLGIGAGVFLLIFGLLGGSGSDRDVFRRLRGPADTTKYPAVPGQSILREIAAEQTGLFKALVPTKSQERTKGQRELMQAGLRGANSLRNFMLMRVGSAFLLPGLLYVAVSYPTEIGFNDPVARMLLDLSPFRLLAALAALLALGFFGPAAWLKGRVRVRRQAIEEGFPNALDLLQIAVEAGLGFDAAINRVALEMRKACPPISEELNVMQQEVLAGRDRGRALLDLAERLGVDEARSFVSVVRQSMQFGTSMSDALLTYAAEMRQTRELNAQKKANELPVKMSGIMAALILPALLIITLVPVALRFMHMFQDFSN